MPGSILQCWVWLMWKDAGVCDSALWGRIRRGERGEGGTNRRDWSVSAQQHHLC